MSETIDSALFFALSDINTKFISRKIYLDKSGNLSKFRFCISDNTNYPDLPISAKSFSCINVDIDMGRKTIIFVGLTYKNKDGAFGCETAAIHIDICGAENIKSEVHNILHNYFSVFDYVFVNRYDISKPNENECMDKAGNDYFSDINKAAYAMYTVAVDSIGDRSNTTDNACLRMPYKEVVRFFNDNYGYNFSTDETVEYATLCAGFFGDIAMSLKDKSKYPDIDYVCLAGNTTGDGYDVVIALKPKVFPSSETAGNVSKHIDGPELKKGYVSANTYYDNSQLPAVLQSMKSKPKKTPTDCLRIFILERCKYKKGSKAFLDDIYNDYKEYASDKTGALQISTVCRIIKQLFPGCESGTHESQSVFFDMEYRPIEDEKRDISDEQPVHYKEAVMEFISRGIAHDVNYITKSIDILQAFNSYCDNNRIKTSIPSIKEFFDFFKESIKLKHFCHIINRNDDSFEVSGVKLV